MMPYTSSATAKAVFENGELARLSYSANNAYPGLFASTNAPDGSYVSTLGIRPLASQPIVNTTMITPYGAYVSILLFPNTTAPLAWLAAMLNADRMQCKYGVIESLAIEGSTKGQVAKMVTWDTKMTTVLALTGGIVDLVKDYMMQDTWFLDFVNRTEHTYSVLFAGSQSVVPDLLPSPQTVTTSVGPAFVC